MAITQGQNAEAGDFIDESEKNATPANDAGRVVKLEDDGKLHSFFTRNGFIPNAGGTINGATLPVPVYQDDSDNEVYACDANDSTKYKFIGFAVSNGTDGNPIRVQCAGIVPGFSGLSEGETYYVQDSAGTIGTSPGTQEILVGVAVSATELLIMKGQRYASGSASLSGTTTSTITLGFRPSKITLYAVGAAADASLSVGSYVNGSQRCQYTFTDQGNANESSAVGVDTDSAWHVVHAATGTTESENHQGVVDQVTDTGFRLNQTKTGGSDTSISIYWVAEGLL